jgi:hypothetical protein
VCARLTIFNTNSYLFVNVESCSLPKETGNCDEKKARWHFSQNDNKCMPFYYTGCGGNENNFESYDVCNDQCPPVRGERLINV